ncbi:hypothetical protein EMCRGX_G003815 [Ephydatia muelleri]
MSKRKESASWKGPTHAVIQFDEEDTTAVVPLKKILLRGAAEQVKLGCSYDVKWTDSKIYKATVHALGSSSEMQDKIDDLQLSSDDNDTRQMDELHEDSDASMKDSEALVSASMLASTAAGREERDVSIQSYDSEPKVDIGKTRISSFSKAKELVRTGDEILKKLRSRSPVAQPQEVAIPIPRTWDGLSFEDAVMKKLDNLEKQMCPPQSTTKSLRENNLCDNFTNSSPKTSCVPIGKRLFSSPAGVSTEAFKKLVGSSSQLVQYTDHQREEKGCWLGNPSSHGDERQKVWIPLGDQGKVEMAETISKNAPRLAVNLLFVFFTREKLASGNCTPAPNRELLDQKVIHGIRRKCKLWYQI